MRLPLGAPILGMDGSGNPINMIPFSDGSVKTAGNIQSMDSSSPPAEDAIIEVTAMTVDGSTVVANGYSVDSKENLTPVIWKSSGSSWEMGTSPAITSRPVALSSKSGKTRIASGEYIYDTTFTNQNGRLVPSITKVTSQVDCLATGDSKTVGSSLSAIGVWVNTGSAEWKHVSLGVPVQVYTGHNSTTFTFPGYSGSDAQVQRISAIPTGDAPPKAWDIYDSRGEGYYGVLSPTLTVSWVVPS